MATIRKPGSDDAVTARTEGGTHPRGTETKNYDRDRHEPPKPSDRPEGDQGGVAYGAGKHFRDTEGGPSDVDRNPGIGSSSGTTDSGEPGLDDTDRGA